MSDPDTHAVRPRLGGPATLGADGRLLPRLADPSVRVLLALVVVLQAISWWILEGYQLADSVEYMERAQALVRSEQVIDSRQVRSFGFSGLLVPFFFLADLVGIEDFRPVVWVLRCFQMALGLGLVLVAARLGARLAGRSAGLAAGFFVGANPVFLQFSVSPLADVAAAICLGRAVEWLLDRADRRAAWHAGLWMGLALLMAYKTIPLSAALLLLVVVRDRRRALPVVGRVALAYGAVVIAQLTLDRLVYGRWGASLIGYFGENVVGVIGRICLMLGLRELGTRVYGWYYSVEETDMVGHGIRQIDPADFYWTHLPEMLVWPVIPLAAIALARCLRRPGWHSGLLLALVALHVALLQQKGSKEFRLWIPVLPLIGALLGQGFVWFAGDPGRRSVWRPMVALGLAAATVVFACDALFARNTRKFAGYWRAMDHVAERAAQMRAADPGRSRVRVACSYHWAVYLRESKDVVLRKLPHQLDGWAYLTQEQQWKDLDALRDQEWFIVHQPVLTTLEHRELMYRVNAWFQVEAVFWDPKVFEDVGPVFVLRRKAREGYEPRLRTFFDVVQDADPDELRRELGFGEPVRLIRPAHDEELWFLGFTYETLPGDGHGWITYYYYAAKPFLADYTFVDRLTSFDERHSWQNNHAPTYGVFRTNQWKAGSVVRESWPVVAAAEPYEWRERFRPMGGPYRRGDYVPAFLWLDVATFYLACKHCGDVLFLDPQDPHVCGGVERGEEDGEIEVSGRLQRARFGEDEPIRRGALWGVTRAPNGWRWSAEDDLNLVGSFFLPVHPSARVPDDGKVLRD